MGLFRDSFVRVISISPKSLFAEEVSLLNRGFDEDNACNIDSDSDKEGQGRVPK